VPTATVRVRLFAGLREQAGWGERHWPASAAAALTPRQLWQHLELPGELTSVRIAINQQFAAADTPLQAGDELAFLPPISGG
jgi:molybdopterin synthase sulfur carrier subunit